MAKVQRWTKKKLRKLRLAQEAERAEELRSEAALRRTPQKWHDHDREMRKMTEGTHGD
jgi:hypothetical protein